MASDLPADTPRHRVVVVAKSQRIAEYRTLLTADWTLASVDAAIDLLLAVLADSGTHISAMKSERAPRADARLSGLGQDSGETD